MSERDELLERVKDIQARLRRIEARDRENRAERRRRPNMTVNEWYDRWIAGLDRSEHTLRAYRNRTAKFRREHGHRRMRFSGAGSRGGVSPQIAKAWAKEHPGTVRYLAQMFRAAVEDGLIDRDPFEGLRPRRKAGTPKVPTPTEIEALTFCARRHLPGPQVANDFAELILFSAYTGLRRGEALALTLEDVMPALSGRRFTVREGKGGKAREVRALGPAAVALRRVVPPTNEWAPRLRVFPFTEREHRTLWEKTRNAADLRGLRWHSLRHFCATWLLERGASKEDVSMQLHGTFNAREIVRTYGHPSVGPALDRLREVAG